jgi:hypothetical protein
MGRGASTAGRSVKFLSHSLGAASATLARAGTSYQNLLIAIAGVTDEGTLWPFGMTHIPKMAPVRSLQLYSTAGAKLT